MGQVTNFRKNLETDYSEYLKALRTDEVLQTEALIEKRRENEEKEREE